MDNMIPEVITETNMPECFPHGRDYERVEQAIRFLEQRSTEQPSLEQVAAHLEMSPFHTQRLFTRWAGVSPKRFLQYLTLEHAKRLLRGSCTVLEATYDTGLSSPGRLHDLCVTLEGITPGECRRQGEGVRIHWGIHASPFGRTFVAATARGLTTVEFLQADDPSPSLARLRAAWPGAVLSVDEASGPTAALARRIFGDRSADDPSGLLEDPGDGGPPRLRLQARGTHFQIRVWEALLRVPPGVAVGYGDLAREVGHPGAARAVGTAVGRNPLAWIIPCHRVLRSTGALGGYRWGAGRKRAILAWESARLDITERVG